MCLRSLVCLFPLYLISLERLGEFSSTITLTIRPINIVYCIHIEFSFNQEGKIAVASSIGFTTTFSTIFFILGCICGNCCQKQKKTTGAPISTPAETSNYGDLQPQYQELEFKENVAYTPVQIAH